jgi:hypothetical protein
MRLGWRRTRSIDALQRRGDRIAAGGQLRLVGGDVGIGLRATPLSIAALATAIGIAEIRRGSNGTGMMYCGPKRGRLP